MIYPPPPAQILFVVIGASIQHSGAVHPTHSIVQKVNPHKIRRTIVDYFRLYRSLKNMQKRLTDEARQYIVRCRKNGIPASKIAKDLGISARHVRRLWERYQKIGDTRLPMGRPKDFITESQM